MLQLQHILYESAQYHLHAMMLHYLRNEYAMHVHYITVIYAPEHIHDDMTLYGMLDERTGRFEARLVRYNNKVKSCPVGCPVQ
jgi:hypothetical protein